MLANNGELDGRRYLPPAAMDELRKEETRSVCRSPRHNRLSTPPGTSYMLVCTGSCPWP